MDGAHLHVHRDSVIFVDGTRKRGRPRLQVRGTRAVGKGRRMGATPFRALLLFFLLVVLFLLVVVIVISLGNLLVAVIVAIIVVVILGA